jgi:hypothetical protein
MTDAASRSALVLHTIACAAGGIRLDSLDAMHETHPVMTGRDLIAHIRNAGVAPEVVARLCARITEDQVVLDLEDVARRASASALGISPGRWNAIFPPLFGEFE